MHAVMSFSVSGSLVSCMEMAVIEDLKTFRRENLFQTSADSVDPSPAHGKTCLKGFTTMDS